MAENETQKMTASASNSSVETDKMLVEFLKEIEATEALEVIAPDVLSSTTIGEARILTSIELDALMGEASGYNLSTKDLETGSELILEAIIQSVDDSIARNDFSHALSHLQVGMTSVFNSFFSRGLSLKGIYSRANAIRARAERIAHGLGAHEFTLEFSVGLSTGLTLGLHFKTPPSVNP